MSRIVYPASLPHIFSLNFLDLGAYTEGSGPFGLGICRGLVTGLQFHSSVCRYPILPATVVEEVAIFPKYIFETLS